MMRKVKSIRVNYIEDNEGKQELIKYGTLKPTENDLFDQFYREYMGIPTQTKIELELPEPCELKSVLFIGPRQINGVHVSERLFVEFQKKNHVVEYISPEDLRDDNWSRYTTKEELYPLSAVVKQAKIRPDLIFIDECVFYWDNDVNIPVYYHHREFKRPPTVYHPDVAFFWHEEIIDYYTRMFAPHWCHQVKHILPLYIAVDPEQYQPEEKVYKGVNGIGYREGIAGALPMNELANIADLHLLVEEEEEFKQTGLNYFDTPVNDEDYRNYLPKCEALWVPISARQYTSRRMLEAMACKTACVIKIENEKHEEILQNMGYTTEEHYFPVEDICEIDAIELVYSKEDLRMTAEMAHEITLEKNTYKNRAEQIIDLYYELWHDVNFKFDVICPVYWTNGHFNENIMNWFREIPINNLYLGINNPKVKIDVDHPQVKIVDQLHLKTLGGCLKDLMERVETRWFVYLHSDVQLSEKSFELMQEFIEPKVGIIESERVHWEGNYMKANSEFIPQYTYDNYFARTRSFSGVQLMRRKTIEPLIKKLQDDYLYRNEDMIFQSECIKNDFKYKKTWAMHVHQTINKEWTHDWEETHQMQWRGFVKYTNPNEINKIPCLAPLKMCKHKYNLRIEDVVIFCQQHNPNWAVIILEEWEKWD